MFHLMIKDFRIQRKKSFLVFFLFIYILNFSNTESSVLIFSAITALIAFVMAVNSNFNGREGNRAQQSLLLSLPVTRKEVIAAKYFMNGVWFLAAFIPGAGLLLIKDFSSFQTGRPMFYLNALILSLCLTYFLMSVYYPVYYRLGYKVAQTAAELFGAISIGLFFSGLTNFTFLNTYLSAVSEQTVLLPAAAITLVAVFISYELSVQFFSSKDF
ncbi:ABC-2 transporter permease [Sporolactobacillus putidus]|uniref:ABC-2 transporter permease n=1 Tax=Sporolactobacillus putidus TaxID=492735 RepID=A0A917VYQ7_9BACL|nr:ABC-2 transporter permease [Sporolactobacillus putidus]GGL46337.1 hypothetical protein GCM10007968_08020 [Sporolactobacillus putidus]